LTLVIRCWIDQHCKWWIMYVL